VYKTAETQAEKSIEKKFRA
jgi:hypothetical protein